MTDPVKTSLLTRDARTKKRNRAETRFRFYGLTAIGAGLAMLVLLLVTIFGNGLGAFQQSFVTLKVPLLESKLDKSGERDLAKIKKVSTFGYAPLLSKSAAADLRGFVIANTDQIGETVEFTFLANSRVDGYLKKPRDPRKHRG